MGGGKSGGPVKNPARWGTANEGVFIGAVRGYAGAVNPGGENLEYQQFVETTQLTATLPGHPLYRPFMLRRYGHNVGIPLDNPLVYDRATGKWFAFLQLQEGMRVQSTATYDLIDDIKVIVGDTVAIEDLTMGVRRLFLVDGLTETEAGISLSLIDVIGG